LTNPCLYTLQIRLEADADSTAALMEAHTAAAQLREQLKADLGATHAQELKRLQQALSQQLRADLGAKHAQQLARLQEELDQAREGWATCQAAALAAEPPARAETVDCCTQVGRVMPLLYSARCSV